MSAFGNLSDQRQHRRVHAVGGEQRRARIEQAGARHHRVGLWLPGRQRGAERHIGAPCSCRRVHRLDAIGGVVERVEEMVVVHARHRVKRVEPVRDQRRRRPPRRSSSPAPLALLFRLTSHAIAPVVPIGPALVEACRFRLCLTKRAPHAFFARSRQSPTSRTRQCIAIAPIPAARFARATSAKTCGFPAGATASATMAACCSSICATIMASPRWWPIPDSPAFKHAEKFRAEWVVRIDGKVRTRPAGTENHRTADRSGRDLYPRDRGARPGRRTAYAGVRRAGISRGHPAQVPLPRSAPRASARQHHAARRESSTRSAAA